MDGSSLRTLQDSGASTSFIRSDIATANNFRILQNDIVLTVKGFNSKKIITTNLVEVVVLVSGTKCYITAECVPELTASSAVKKAVKIVEDLMKFCTYLVLNLDWTYFSASASQIRKKNRLIYIGL